MNDVVTTQVAVIGVGFSGLAAARKLHQAGCEVTVLKARDRVGSRIWGQLHYHWNRYILETLLKHGGDK